MSIWILIVGLVVGLALAALFWRFRGDGADVGSALLVLGIAALAVVVTVIRVQQYWDQQAQAAAAQQEVAANAPAPNPGPPPLTNGPPRESVNAPTLPPLMHPATGYAAPPAAPNPYSGG